MVRTEPESIGIDTSSPRLSRRRFLGVPLGLGAAAILARLDCGGVLGPDVGRPLVWRLHGLAVQGDFSERDRFGRGEIRCVDPSIVARSAGRLVVARHTAPEGNPAAVEVPLRRARSVIVSFTRPGSACDLFVEDPDPAAIGEALVDLLPDTGRSHAPRLGGSPPGAVLAPTRLILVHAYGEALVRRVLMHPWVHFDPAAGTLAVDGETTDSAATVPLHALRRLVLDLDGDDTPLRQLRLSWSRAAGSVAEVPGILEAAGLV